ncbi:phosphate ABC transporter permease subunit PstC [Phytoactinopolyspora halotolerans]|uniref:Phosphate transport system permease protein n=1 Tax=Phytoactinopolyspora halotolerans TaxID=1981512 RepID=A0A6L9S2S2_9ACTN|nr:phosphate ABC transporter permease subunit PstC [Phytoactinopolyspora halotolerans]NED99356.1 phosphate ABC transporter permease subunit PstC [Phytoactinopolyspora halotolerans]
MTTTTKAPPEADQRPSGRRGSVRPGDRNFSIAARAAGILILIVLAGVTVFLVSEALPTFQADPSEIEGGEGFFSYVWPLVFGTLVAALIALIVATPLALGIALFISHYAPRRMSQGLGYVVDLLAAIPSVVYGLWGIQWLAPNVQGAWAWLAENLGFIPLFTGPASATGRTMMTAGLVLAVMVLPIITAVSREVFLQTPKLHEEAALALGATRWEMIRMSVIPFGKPGVIGGVMLGLGRALGETMAVAMVLSTGGFTWSLVSSGNNTIAAEIALDFPESSGLKTNTLIAAGLVLFVITLGVNMLARWIVSRRKEFSGAN